MRWEAFLAPVRRIEMRSQRLSVAAIFPAGTLAVEEALARQPTAVLLGYPYYQKGEVFRYWPRATARIRRRLYSLALPSLALQIVDLGDVYVPEEAPSTPSQALEEAVKALLQAGHKVVVFGGGQEAALPLFRAVAAQEVPFTYTLLDRKLDLFDALSAQEAPHRRYHQDLLLDEQIEVPFRGQVVGLAWHWVSPVEEEVLHTYLRVPYLRLSQVLSDPDEAEPFLRMAALITMDLGLLRGADAPAVLDPEPEGLPIEIAAKLMRFAGMGYRSDVLHLANYFPPLDRDGRTAAAVALLLWYFLEGRINPEEDFPWPDRANLERYEVSLGEVDVPSIVFYRHPRSGRWWMEVVPLSGKGPARLVPCSRTAYEAALGGEVPALWYLWQLTVP